MPRPKAKRLKIIIPIIDEPTIIAPIGFPSIPPGVETSITAATTNITKIAIPLIELIINEDIPKPECLNCITIYPFIKCITLELWGRRA